MRRLGSFGHGTTGRCPFRLCLPLVLLVSSGTLAAQAEAAPPSPPVLTGDAAHPAAAQGWVETRLFFGLGPADAAHTGVSDATWRRFLDREVTPRFPAGLSVLEVYGQWLGKPTRTSTPRSPERIRSRMLLIAYPPTPENNASIEAIRSAWKSLTGDQSVLRLTSPVEVSF